MKMKRTLSVFLPALMLVSLLASPFAAAAEPSLPADPEIMAKAALLVDAETDAIAYEKNAHQILYPASLTKIMTAILTLEAIESGRISLYQEVTASETAVKSLPSDSSNAGIKVGEVLTVENLLYCMMVVSANESANILAETVAGSIPAFVAEMNKKAEALGCENTHFMNPHGYHDSQHYTSAWDMYLITKEAMRHKDFMRFADTANIVIPATNMSKERNYWTTNHLLATWRVLGYRNPEAHGIKTGSTDAAGLCLISSAQRGTLHYVSVILGAERTEENGVGNLRSFSETTRMFNYGFDNFGYQTIIEAKDPVCEVAVTLSEVERVVVSAAEDTVVLMPNGLKPEHLERDIHLIAESVEAPLQAGTKMGTVDLRYGDTVYATVDLLAMHDVEVSEKLVFIRDAKEFLARPIVKIGAVAFVLLILLIIILRLATRRRRYRYGSRGGRSRSGYRGRRR